MKKVFFALVATLAAWVVLSYVECVMNVWGATYDYYILNFFSLLF